MRLVHVALALWLVAGCREEQAPVHVSKPSAERGRELYLRGVSASGAELQAELGAGNVVPAAAVPCASCHGKDGRGRAEGGVQPSNIRWEALTRPYVVQEGSGRRHPPYTERTLGRAITMGVDPANQRLLDVMPRFRLSRADLDDLLAYLKVLGQEQDPGMSEDEVRLGAVFAGEGPEADAGRAVHAALSAYLDELNARGGIYGRRLVLRSVKLPAPGPEREKTLEAFLDGERPLVLVGAMPGEEALLSALAEQRRIPLLGAMGTAAGAAPGGQTFYLYAGLAEQGEALVSVAAKRRPGGRVAILRPDAPSAREAAGRIAARCRKLGLGEVVELEALGQSSALGRADVLFVLGPRVVEPGFWKDLGRLAHAPLVLWPGGPTEASLRAPASLAGRLFTSHWHLPTDVRPEALQAYHQLAASRSLPREHLAAQLVAVSTGKLLVEGLIRAGRDANRERMVEALEGVRDFETGLGPPLTYGRSRRVGALGAYVLEVDPVRHQLASSEGWAGLE
ncbi:ABC transporter substrate-binding protein [Pyxidicoccus fallax]|uniref:ABC transporter substrate-binding protein n=1 Tax=Pyxidicoccus fallax TaxID=394095 RepID=A0A848LDP7_9BACT|nr:ABC transporter substrate-binding protein [Pyxidicoccus fallax]NMO16524.1 ABC transporter substrate-binding protein [Pyxidicoccus fallax]NPC78155.1 ABC transporter substrate-binding protein [Pyxidicoccus fallax]